MDKICIWLEKLIWWIDRCGPPPVIWIGRAGGRFNNPPAPHLEIVYVLEGACPELHIGDRRVGLRAGEVSLHGVHLGNVSPPDGHFKAWCLFLDVGAEREFDSLRSVPLFCSTRVMHRREIERAFAELASRCYRYGEAPGKGYLDPGPLFAGRAPGSVPFLLVRNALLDLLALLLEESRRAGGDTKAALPAAVRKSMEFMAAHLNTSSVTLADIARSAALSVDHFGRLFRQQVGITPMCWLRTLRIQQSRFLLERTALSMEEIAPQVGFADPLHFSRVFRKQLGLSPTRYRRERLEAQ